MEITMHYKTIVLELLKERPKIHRQLRRKRMLLQTVERYAKELRATHETWKDRLFQARPGSDPSQIVAEALEIALKELEGCLPSGDLPNQAEPLFLETELPVVRGRKTTE